MINKLLKRFHFKILFSLLLTCGCWTGTSVFAQTPVVKSSVDMDRILIGEQIKYRVEISFPINKYRLEWYTPPEDFNHFEIVAKDEIDSSVNNDINTFGQTMILTSFDSGRQYIPAMPLKLKAIEGEESFTMYTDSIPINVMHSPLDSIQPFHDIKSIIEIKAGWEWWIWVLIIAGAILLVMLIVFLVKRFKKEKATGEIFASKLSPYEEAVQAISALEHEKLLDNQKEKEFHSRLSHIFKRYLSRKLNANKMHLTTGDLLIELTPMNVQKSSIEKVAKALHMGNAAKFAQYIPPVSESEQCKNVVKEIISEINSFIDKKEEPDGR